MLINGHELCVELHGPAEGPAVVLLHHGLGSLRAWREQLGVLTEAGFRVLVYDRWGYGGSDARPSLDVPSFTTDLADLQLLLEKLGLHRTALVGHSDGGTLALYYAAAHPQQVTSLVTIAAHIFFEPSMEPGILEVKQSFEVDERFRLGLQYVHGSKYEAVFQNWFDGWHQERNITWDMRPLLQRIQCPTLVIQGTQDEHATPYHARAIAESIPGAELVLMEAACHMLPQENATQFNPLLLEFLNRHRAARYEGI